MRSHLPRGGDGEWKQKGGWVLLGSVCFRLAWVGQSQAGPGQWLAHITGILAPAFYRRLFSLYLWMFLCVCMCASVVRKSICVCVLLLLLLCVQYLLATDCATILSLTLLPFAAASFSFFSATFAAFLVDFYLFLFQFILPFRFPFCCHCCCCHFHRFYYKYTQTHTEIHRYLYIYTLTHVASSNIVCPS